MEHLTKFTLVHDCAKRMDTYAEHEPWFGLEQEYNSHWQQMGDVAGGPVGGFQHREVSCTQLTFVTSEILT